MSPSAVQVCTLSPDSPSTVAALAGSMRDTISARSVKEALGQVRTWRAEVEGTCGQGHSSPGPHTTALGCLASPQALSATLCGLGLLRCSAPWSWGRAGPRRSAEA